MVHGGGAMATPEPAVGIKIVDEAKLTVPVRKSGGSLILNLTPALKAIGAEQGDIVFVTVRKA